jgi:Ca-activated chloride channel family protein
MRRNIFIFAAVLLVIAITGCAPQESQNAQKKQELVGDVQPERARVQDPRQSHPSQTPPVTEAREEKPDVSNRLEIQPIAPPPPPAAMAPASSANKPMSISRNDGVTRGGMSRPAEPAEDKSSNALSADRESYQHLDDNQIKDVKKQPISTFSIDVDTGSYSNVRRMLKSGLLPRKDAVRVEELINYFNYDYPTPEQLDPPFKVTTQLAATPWNKNTYLLQIGIKGYEVPKSQLPPSNLVFLIDVSGSMDSEDKLGLLKSAFKLLVNQLSEKDKISIVVYAGASGVALEPTAGNEKAKIISAINQLTASGSTHGSAGINLAYLLAEQGFIKNGINRVLLATDGDFNVGTVNFEALKNLIETKRKTGISLTTLGFGTGNYNEQLMEQLADAGNGNYAYIDTLNEAQKVLVEEMSATLQTIAKDVKIQIEFNPNNVAEYRLIGYENRLLKQEDFSNDKVDAGDIGAGHTVTALYEIALAGSKGQRLENMRYAEVPKQEKTNYSNELAFLRLRYKAPTGDISKLLEYPVERANIIDSLDKTSENYRFAAAVAAFGQLLRGGTYTENFSYDDVAQLAGKVRGEDKFNYRGEFMQLVQLAKSLEGKSPREKIPENNW